MVYVAIDIINPRSTCCCLASGPLLKNWSLPEWIGISALTSYQTVVGPPCPLATLPPNGLLVFHAEPLGQQPPCSWQSSNEEGWMGGCWPGALCSSGAVPSRCQAHTLVLRGNLRAQNEEPGSWLTHAHPTQAVAILVHPDVRGTWCSSYHPTLVLSCPSISKLALFAIENRVREQVTFHT